MHTINYGDGEKEILNLTEETWRYTSEDVLHTSLANTPSMELASTTQEVLKSYYEHFGYKDFRRSHAQGFSSFPIINAFAMEEEKCKETVKLIHRSDVLTSANVTTSHVIYKVKENDDKSLMMQARIAPHGNMDQDKVILNRFCYLSTCWYKNTTFPSHNFSMVSGQNRL